MDGRHDMRQGQTICGNRLSSGFDSGQTISRNFAGPSTVMPGRPSHQFWSPSCFWSPVVFFRSASFWADVAPRFFRATFWSRFSLRFFGAPYWAFQVWRTTSSWWAPVVGGRTTPSLASSINTLPRSVDIARANARGFFWSFFGSHGSARCSCFLGVCYPGERNIFYFLVFFSIAAADQGKAQTNYVLSNRESFFVVSFLFYGGVGAYRCLTECASAFP